MAKQKAQVAPAATLSEQQKLDEEQKTAAEAVVEEKEAEEVSPSSEETSQPAPDKDMAAYVAELERRVADSERVVDAVVRQKKPPKVKRPRPAGKYRLVSPYWDGKRRREVGTELSFPEGMAPQSAKFLD